MWVFRVCRDLGTVNELCCGDGNDIVASRMMNTFDTAGYKYMDYVDGSVEMTYTLERRRNND